VKITIDTKEDSHEDIMKVLQILTHAIDNKINPILAESKQSVDTTNMMSMFSPTDDSNKNAVRDTAPNFTSLMNLMNSKSKKDDEYKVEFF